jgi:predicted DNA-binding protein (MmcQ/YjbR family)
MHMDMCVLTIYLKHYLRDLTLRAGINWEKQWANVSAEVKGKLFAVVSEYRLMDRKWTNERIGQRDAPHPCPVSQ